MFPSVSEAPESLFHEVATIFPPMGEMEFAHFVADIEQRGLQEPIWRYQGKIIDGVHRYRACQQLGREPTYREWDGVGSLVAFVVSLNLERRHLTSSQKAMIALNVEQQFAKEAHQRMQAGVKVDPVQFFGQGSGRASDQAAKMTGTNGQYILDAKRIVTRAPELQVLVTNGLFTIPDAKLLAHLPQRTREQAVQLVKTKVSKTAKAAVLEIKKAEQAAQTQATPEKPWITRLPWDQWLPGQPPCDLLLTDPPYSTDVENIERFANAWLPQALAKVASTGRAYVCIGAYPQEIRAYLNVQACWPVAQILVWEYKNTLGPSPKRAYKQNWQAILYFCGPDAPPLDCPILTEQLSVQAINAPDGRFGNRFHTWQKPDDLAEQLIRHSTKPGDRIYDLFSGTGTFLLAAQRLGRLGLGCDNSEAMLTIAEQRGCAIAR